MIFSLLFLYDHNEIKNQIAGLIGVFKDIINILLESFEFAQLNTLFLGNKSGTYL